MFQSLKRKRNVSEQVVPANVITNDLSSSGRRLSGSRAARNPFEDPNYPIPDFERVYNLMRDPERGLKLGDRRWRLLTYSKCFVGSDAVQWMVDNLSLDRDQAIATGQRLMEAGIIHHVTNSETFGDEYYYYRFQEDDDTNILNMKRVWDVSIETRPAVDVAKDLLTRLALLCEEHRKHILAADKSPSLPSAPATPIIPTSHTDPSTQSPHTPRLSDPNISASSTLQQHRNSSTPPLTQAGPAAPTFSTPQLSTRPRLNTSPTLSAPFMPALSTLCEDIDYSTLARSERFRQYTLAAAEFQRVQLVALNHDERIAFFVNMYNVLCLHAHVIHGPPNSFLRRYTFFRALSYRIAGLDMTLDDIEHGVLRGNKRPPMIMFLQQLRPSDPKCQFVLAQRDGRIHFVISAGTKSDPPIRILDGENVQEELHNATVEFLSVTVKVDPEKKIVTLPRIFLWYADDFPRPEKKLLLWVAQYLPVRTSNQLVALVEKSDSLPAITYENFDWSKADASFNASVVRRKRRKLERERTSPAIPFSAAVGVDLTAVANGLAPIIAAGPYEPPAAPLSSIPLIAMDPRSPAASAALNPASESKDSERTTRDSIAQEDSSVEQEPQSGSAEPVSAELANDPFALRSSEGGVASVTTRSENNSHVVQ